MLLFSGHGEFETGLLRKEPGIKNEQFSSEMPLNIWPDYHLGFSALRSKLMFDRHGILSYLGHRQNYRKPENNTLQRDNNKP